MPSQNVDFNDLFKSELGDDHLVDCPHCEAPITKGDLNKAHKGKGKVTHVSGPKQGKSSAHVRDHNPEGGAMRGGDGRGVHTSSRGVPGAKKTDAVAGVQNGKGSSARKGGNADSSVEEGEDDVGSEEDMGKSEGSTEHGFKPGQSVVHNPSADKNASGTPGKVGPRTTGTHVHFVPASGKGRMVHHDDVQAAPSSAKKSMVTVRGTEWVQYVDDGSDAALAKSISEGVLGGTSPTRPLDLNNDLTRLLV